MPRRCPVIDTKYDLQELHDCALQLTQDYLPSDWQRVPSSAFTKVAHSGARQLYYKEFLPRSPAESMKAVFRGSRATRARRNGDALLLAGIDAPVNIHWGKLPGNREYLFCSAAAGQGLDRWLRDDPGQRSGEQLRTRRRLLQALGIFIGRLHATGFIHGDLRPGNVLAAFDQGRFHFTLIDNERLVRKTPAPGKMLLRNLMQLNMLPPGVLSQSDRMRFFCAWRSQMRDLSPVEAKVIGSAAWHWAMRRMYDKGQL